MGVVLFCFEMSCLRWGKMILTWIAWLDANTVCAQEDGQKKDPLFSGQEGRRCDNKSLATTCGGRERARLVRSLTTVGTALLTLGWLQVPASSIQHHFPRKQLTPPELPQADIQRRAKKWNLCGRVDTLLVRQEFSPRWSSNRLLTKSASFPPTLGMFFPLSTVSRAVLEGLCRFLMSLRACHISKFPFYPLYFTHFVYCSPHEHLIQNDMRELPAQIKLLFIEQ